MNQYCDLAVLKYHLKKQEQQAEKEKVQQEINKLIEHCIESNQPALIDLYHDNALFAEKMAKMLEASAIKLYTHALTEKNTQGTQENFSRSVAMIADAVLWEDIAAGLYDQMDEVEEAMDSRD